MTTHQQATIQPDIFPPASTISSEKMDSEHQHSYDEKHHHRSSKWAFGMFDCFAPLSTCCLGFWCPCYLFGKTYERNKTGEADPSGCNSMCAAYYFVGCCGFASCFQCVNRGNTREKYNINGGMVGDFCASLWCGCCTLIQEEKESIVRQTGMDPKTKQPYQPVTQMSYP